MYQEKKSYTLYDGSVDKTIKIKPKLRKIHGAQQRSVVKLIWMPCNRICVEFVDYKISQKIHMTFVCNALVFERNNSYCNCLI